MRLYEQAVKYNHLDAICSLGVCYEQGSPEVPQDLSKAVKLYQKGVDLGSARVMTCLGDLWKDGRGVPQDLSRGMQYFDKAADLNYAPAFVRLAKCHYDNNYPEIKDYSYAIRLLRRAAELGDAYAQGVIKNLPSARDDFTSIPK